MPTNGYNIVSIRCIIILYSISVNICMYISVNICIYMYVYVYINIILFMYGEYFQYIEGGYSIGLLHLVLFVELEPVVRICDIL